MRDVQLKPKEQAVSGQLFLFSVERDCPGGICSPSSLCSPHCPYLNEFSSIQRHLSLRSVIRQFPKLRACNLQFFHLRLSSSFPTQPKKHFTRMFLVQRRLWASALTFQLLGMAVGCEPFFLWPCDLKMLIYICFWKGDDEACFRSKVNPISESIAHGKMISVIFIYSGRLPLFKLRN